MASKLSSSPTLPTYGPTGFTGLGVIEADDFYGENSREIQKADRALELSARGILCHNFKIYYDAVIWWDGRGWAESDYWLRPSSDKEYEMCLFAPTEALAIQHKKLFGIRLTPDIGGVSEDPRTTLEKREAYREIRDDLGEFLEDNWQAITHEAEILFRLNRSRGIGERCERHGIKFGAGVKTPPTSA
jgi:hypothetical protein